jgi:dTDP-4-amino-4,6-dideoxygalactose transaminase
MNYKIPFNRPPITGAELNFIKQTILAGKLSGDGYFTKKCHLWFENKLRAKKAFLTASGSLALDMMAILTGLQREDEVIMPSFNFPATANAVVLREATPVFVDIRKDTLNIDERLVREVVTPKTKAIFVVHYGGVGCEMDQILAIAKKYNLYVLEDAAQGFLATYKDRFLGTIGDMGSYSFHELKVVTSGEGGVLLVNNEKFTKSAEIVWEKGTNRRKFYRGEVKKYSWVGLGSSFLPSELISAFLYGQLKKARKIVNFRLRKWNYYHKLLLELEKEGYLKRPRILDHCNHNGSVYYILVGDEKTRDNLITFLKRKRILAVFHYTPLHSSKAGMKYGKYIGDMKNTISVAETIVRLPLYYGITEKEINYVYQNVKRFFKGK